MKPLVIISEFNLFGRSQMLYNVVWNWRDYADQTEVSKEKALQVIEKYQLPMVYKNQYGEIYADEKDSPYMEYKEDYIKNAPKDRREMLRKRRKWIIEEMGGGAISRQTNL